VDAVLGHRRGHHRDVGDLPSLSSCLCKLIYFSGRLFRMSGISSSISRMVSLMAARSSSVSDPPQKFRTNG
jgi:hypothetical protein